MMPNDQPETPGEAKPVAASGGALPPETPPQALANTASPGDTESVPDPPDGENSVSEVEEATLPPRSVQPASSAEGATRPPRSVFDAPQSRPGNACVNEGACSRLETSWFDGDPLTIEACLEQVPAPELPDTTEELVCIEMEFLWKQSVSASQGDNTSDAESSILILEVLCRAARAARLATAAASFRSLWASVIRGDRGMLCLRMPLITDAR